jgi:hypothetical protein
VVIGAAANGGEIKAMQAGVAEDAEVGPVRHALVDFVHQGIAHGRRRRLQPALHQRAVAGRRFKHQQRPGIAPVLEVEHEAGLPGQRVLRREQARAQQARLLPIGDQDDHVPLQCRPGAQGADGFQQRRDGGAVVGRAKAGGGRIVVGCQQQRRPRMAAGQPRHDVVQLAGHRITLHDADPVLHLRLQSQRLQARH